MEAFLFAVNAVLPIVLAVAIGYLSKKAGILQEGVAKHLNRLVFRVLLPCNLFLNVYRIKDIGSVDLGYVWFVMAATLVMVALTLPVALATTRDRAQRGALAQAAFRSNYALVGIPLATSLFGDEGAMLASLLSAFTIPLYNVLAVVILTVFGSGERVSVKRILLGILKNPLIGSTLLGVACLGVRAILARAGIGFRLSDMTPVFSVMEQLSRAATPLALLSLGAQFSFSAIPALFRQICAGTLLRTVAVPAVALTAAYLMGCFQGAHFATFVAVFATPVAISSVPMAQEMGADATLAGQLLVFTTLTSGVTLFLFSFILKAIGVFA